MSQWKIINKEQIKNVPEGTPIRINGTETILTRHYPNTYDYGFDFKGYLPYFRSSTFGCAYWNDGYVVEIFQNIGHPHAGIMLDYAKEAQTNPEPWKEFQIKRHNGTWDVIDEPLQFLPELEYRRKPKVIIINGYEIPEPLKDIPRNGSRYWAVELSEESGCCEYTWNSDDIDKTHLANGTAHSTPEASKLHAKALRSFTR